MKHRSSDLVTLFNTTFQTSHNTVLVGGGEEPIYRPADEVSPYHRIIFTRDYFASALHEIAHWCIAGPARRCLVDYGYYYEPDGRSAEQQVEFERVEARPQAIERAFAEACGAPFWVSLDNLGGECGDPEAFEGKVNQCFREMRTNGYPQRAKRFLGVLTAYYRD